MVKTFTGGIHPPDFKELTKDLAIADAPMPGRVVVPLAQHIGAPCAPTVAKKDRVLTGQVIGEPQGFVSAPIHATVTGTVVDVVDVPHPILGRPAPAVIIEREGADEWAEGVNQPLDPTNVSPDDLKQMVHDAGIVGMGGATFPTHVKLSPPPNQPVDTVIVNGAECEPFLNCDNRLMLEKPREVIDGLRLVMRILGCKRGVMAIESNKPEAISVMRRTVGDDAEVSVQVVKVKYPQGAEHQLIKAVLGREIPWKGGLPMAIGALVQNVGTLYAIQQAVTRRMPLIERVLTITGDAVAHPANLRVRIGTSIDSLLETAGVDPEASKLILGGPMMGLAQLTAELPVSKGTSGILLLKDAGRVVSGPCIRCGRCLRACPLRLVPALFSRAVEAEDFDYALAHDVLECKECGCCAYVCPGRRPIVQQVKLVKAEAQRRKAEQAAAAK